MTIAAARPGIRQNSANFKPNIVQSGWFVDNGTGNFTGPQTINLGWTTTPGNALLVLPASEAGAVDSVSGAGATWYSKLSREPANFDYEEMPVWYGEVTAAVNNITVTLSTVSGTRVYIFRVYEISGLPLGRTILSSSTMSSQTNTNAPTAGDAVPTTGSQLVVVAFSVPGNTQTENLTGSTTFTYLPANSANNWILDTHYNPGVNSPATYPSLNVFIGLTVAERPGHLNLFPHLIGSRLNVAISAVIG
ncbi:MAG TPA: hypothetical protein VG992_01910 [Candidatus Saccharimonadales bacterium]|nr:hypothetical protein [Candidatus Saccharimonadales bacterium]